MNSNTTIHYVIVRRDLPFGVTLAQTAHAAAESNDGRHYTVAVLGVRDEQRLLKLERKLRKNKVPIVAIREPDAPFFGQLMAIGVQPADREVVSKFFEKLQTYREFEGPRVENVEGS